MLPQILYVEDDESLSFVTRDHLEMQGYQITHLPDGKAALPLVKAGAQGYDLCIFDVMLPEVDGFELAKTLRQANDHIPILFLTAKSMKEDRINGLRLGADDYLTKPFSIEELILKIEVFLRRTRNGNGHEPAVTANPPDNLVTLGICRLDCPNLKLTVGDQVNSLTQRECDLLSYFLRQPNQLLKRSDILETFWGEDDYFMGRSLDVFISRLRKYLRQETRLRLENVHGVGFRLTFEE